MRALTSLLTLRDQQRSVALSVPDIPHAGAEMLRREMLSLDPTISQSMLLRADELAR